LQAVKGAIPEIAQLLAEQEAKNYYTQDQDWLAEQIWPRIKDNCLIHDETYETEAEGISAVKPFPISKEATLHHIGAARRERSLLLRHRSTQSKSRNRQRQIPGRMARMKILITGDAGFVGRAFHQSTRRQRPPDHRN